MFVALLEGDLSPSWECRKCNAVVASKDDLIDVHDPNFHGRTGLGHYTVVNPLGVTIRLLTVSKANINEGIGSISWFAGYKGRVVRCSCRHVIGWAMHREMVGPAIDEEKTMRADDRVSPNALRQWDVIRRAIVFRLCSRESPKKKHRSSVGMSTNKPIETLRMCQKTSTRADVDPSRTTLGEWKALLKQNRMTQQEESTKKAQAKTTSGSGHEGSPRRRERNEMLFSHNARDSGACEEDVARDSSSNNDLRQASENTSIEGGEASPRLKEDLMDLDCTTESESTHADDGTNSTLCTPHRLEVEGNTHITTTSHQGSRKVPVVCSPKQGLKVHVSSSSSSSSSSSCDGPLREPGGVNNMSSSASVVTSVMNVHGTDKEKEPEQSPCKTEEDPPASSRCVGTKNEEKHEEKVESTDPAARISSFVLHSMNCGFDEIGAGEGASEIHGPPPGAVSMGASYYLHEHGAGEGASEIHGPPPGTVSMGEEPVPAHQSSIMINDEDTFEYTQLFPLPWPLTPGKKQKKEDKEGGKNSPPPSSSALTPKHEKREASGISPIVLSSVFPQKKPCHPVVLSSVSLSSCRPVVGVPCRPVVLSSPSVFVPTQTKEIRGKSPLLASGESGPKKHAKVHGTKCGNLDEYNMPTSGVVEGGEKKGKEASRRRKTTNSMFSTKSHGGLKSWLASKVTPAPKSQVVPFDPSSPEEFPEKRMRWSLKSSVGVRSHIEQRDHGENTWSTVIP